MLVKIAQNLWNATNFCIENIALLVKNKFFWRSVNNIMKIKKKLSMRSLECIVRTR